MSPLKFFRIYNKYILAVGVSLLMIAFLIQPTMSLFMPDPSSQPIGYIDGEAVTSAEQSQAAGELQMLEMISRIAQPDAPLPVLSPNVEPLQWALMKREAQMLGLSASEYEINELLALLGVGQDQLVDALRQRQFNVKPESIRQTLRSWLTVQQYAEVVFGRMHLATAERLQMIPIARRFAMFGIGGDAIATAYRGMPRISEPLLQRMLFDQGARMKIAAVAVPAKFYLDEVDPQQIKDSTLTALFEKYRDKFPGDGEPYPFGYMFPDRVKLEYLALPFERLRNQAKVDDADAYEFYLNNKDQFIPQGKEGEPKPTEPRPYEEVVGEIRRQLRDAEAIKLGQSMLKSAQAIFEEDARRLQQRAGYYVTEGEDVDWTPISLEKVAEQLQTEFGLLPDVVQIDRWLDRERLNLLTRIGRTVLPTSPGAQPIPFADYVMSAAELNDTDDNPLLALRLQAKIPSQPVISPATRDMYMFRITEADFERVPRSLDEVRDQVLADARLKQAYEEKLIPRQDEWVKQAREDPAKLDALAGKASTEFLQPPAFPRRESTGFVGGVTVPEIQGIGQSEKFVDAVFEAAESLTGADTKLESLPAEQRLVTIPLPQQLSLYLVRLDDYQPMTEQSFKADAGDPWVALRINQAVLGDKSPQSPISIEAISKRIGFKEVGEE